MRKVTIILMLALVFAGCKPNTKKTETEGTQAVAAVSRTDTAAVKVNYFHGKQRCKTCIAVGNVAKATVEKAYADNNRVVYYEINTNEDSAKGWIEQYDVTWNALIIDKGGNSVEITKQAFATALENPQALEDLIIKEVNKRLQ
ncbi:MAG: nitrophenyl compound nitroreductase subunit ArsF family protein [Bacteroidales bacterium]|nr:nitrophenyl compound nitroreductase subunit ArsF family protein [Bacteroidales bacterium]